MQSCPACGTAAPEQSRFCSVCGAPFITDGETRLATTPPTRPRTTPLTGFTAPDTDFNHGRFVPGATLAGRYRVIGRIGRGGMGEVYRADDLKLGQQVALKFLSDDMSQDAARLSQFHGEVRLARQVSHPSVCRVYDIDDDGGRTFLSMEYIDGEDLGSLLRRIGRLPQDKALELSRQLCAGLAAAHERGVIHRDLKPANLMINSEGRLKITDFGIAALANQGGPTAGTPGYMAPELLAGAPADIRSDVYALGLVMYELFTGKRAFGQGTLADVVRAQQDTQPTAPSVHVRDLDPSTERVILRCLQREPERRPTSALAVSAQLPGGDPLAAALAAGETPSPQMVAAAGEAEALTPWKGVTLLGLTFVAMAAVVILADRTYLPNMLSLQKPPEVLADRAADLLARAGYTERVDRAQGFSISTDYLKYVARTDQRPDRWRRLRDARGATALFWFRTSPRPIVAMSESPSPELHDPPMNISGQAGVILDLEGRLLELHGVPPQMDEGAGSGQPADWKPLFDAAGLDLSRFAPAAPAWTPRSYADTRAAWTGIVPEHPDVELRVEAASYRGRPVSFSVMGPWTEPTRMREPSRSRLEVVLSAAGGIVVIAMLLGAVVLAWRNARRGRGDRHGAMVAALAILTCSFGARLLRMTHVADPDVEFDRFLLVAVENALLDFGLMWSLYMALEPSVRRFWPDALKGWSRLVSGRLRDARVGRDVLYGVVAGLILIVVGLLHDVLPPAIGRAQPMPSLPWLNTWLGTRLTLADTLNAGRNAIQSAGLVLFVVVLLRMILRSRVAAVASTVAIFVTTSAAWAASSYTPVLDIAFVVLLVVLLVAVVVRFGFLTTVITFFTYSFLNGMPLTSSFGTWYGWPSMWAVTLTLALAAIGFWLSRAGAPLFGRALLDD